MNGAPIPLDQCGLSIKFEFGCFTIVIFSLFIGFLVKDYNFYLLCIYKSFKVLIEDAGLPGLIIDQRL
jgi:hypothetical protein